MKFDGSILVLGDLGQLKAYKVAEVSGTDRHESMQVTHMQHHGTERTSTVLDLIKDIEYTEPHMKTDKLISDQAGRFDTSTGEAHNTQLENDRRALKAISEDIRSIIEKESPSSWYLAFPKETHNELRGMLSESITKNLKKVVPSNLTKTAKDKLLSHFE